MCREHEPEWWQASESDLTTVSRAVAVCKSCPLQASCLKEALAIDAHGIWGGTTRSQRNRLRKELQKPPVNLHGMGMGPYREHLAIGELPCLDCCHYIVRVERSKRPAARTGQAPR
jgi:hypothetical protein